MGGPLAFSVAEFGAQDFLDFADIGGVPYSKITEI